MDRRMATMTGSKNQSSASRASRHQDIPDDKKLQRFSLPDQENALKQLIEDLVGKNALSDEPNQLPKTTGKPADALQKKLASIKKYLRMINGGAGAESSRDQHITKRIVNVQIMEIKVQLLNEDSSQNPDRSSNNAMSRQRTIRHANPQANAASLAILQISSLFDKLSEVKIFEQLSPGEAFCTPIIIYQSVVTVRIYYLLESEDQDLQTDPKFFEWTLEVDENQKQMLQSFQTKCQHELIALPDQKSLINYLMAVFDGERVTARVKQFMCMIQKLTTDYMLNAFHKSTGKLHYERGVEQDSPPQQNDHMSMGSKASKKSAAEGAMQANASKEFQKVQGDRDPEFQVKETPENLRNFVQANEKYQKKQQDALEAQARRCENLYRFKMFVQEWQHQLAIFFFSQLKDSDLKGFDESENFHANQYEKNTKPKKDEESKGPGDASNRGQNQMNGNEKQYRRQDVMENFRMRVLRNLDIAIEIVLQEGSLILKKYNDLQFYLDNIAYGRIENFKAEQRKKKIEKDRMEKKAKREKGKTPAKDRNSNPVASVKGLPGKQPKEQEQTRNPDDPREECDLTKLARQVLVEKKQSEVRQAVIGGTGKTAGAGNTPGGGGGYGGRVPNTVLRVNDLLDPTPKPPNYQNQYDRNISAQNQRILKYGAVRDTLMEDTPGQTPQDDEHDGPGKSGHVPEISFNIAEFL